MRELRGCARWAAGPLESARLFIALARFHLAAKSDKRDVVCDVMMRDPVTDTSFPLRVRVFSGDLFILTEVFFDECYRLPERRAAKGEGQAPQRILDLGGNIGLSAAYFLARFPEAEVFPWSRMLGTSISCDTIQRNLAIVLAHCGRLSRRDLEAGVSAPPRPRTASQWRPSRARIMARRIFR